MSELTAIRTALAAALSAGLGEGFQVSAYRLAAPTYPSVEVWPDSITYHQAMSNGLAFWTFTVRAYTGITTDIGAQQDLDALLGENGSGVKAAIETDRTLGGVCNRVTVRSAGNYQTYVTADGGQLVGADWTVEVLL